MKPTDTYDFAFVIPIGKGAHPWLRQALRSLAVQDCRVTVAICAVEDSPSLQSILSEFSELIDHVRIGPDKGQSDAINQGWKALEAHIYGWLNDDDMLHPDATGRALQFFKQGASVVHGRTDILENGSVRVGYGDRRVTASLLHENTIAQPSTFVAREALAAVDLEQPGEIIRSVDLNLHYAMDWDLWRRLYKSGATFARTPQTLSLTRWYDGTKTASGGWKKYREYLNLMSGDVSPTRAAFTVSNMLLHNLSSYGGQKWMFKPLKRLLTAADRETNQDNTSAGLDIFHYSGKIEKVQFEVGDEHMSQTLASAESLSVPAAEASVSFT